MKFLLSLILLLACGAASAQTLSFNAQTTTGSGSVVPVLTWSTTPAATSCTATGDVAWAGTKTGSGTQTLPATTKSVTYNLSCSWPAPNFATITWVPPTTNTDGSTLTDLKGFRLYAGNTSPPTSMATNIASASTLSYVMTPLPAGTWFFGATAYNSLGVESSMSNIASKTLSAASISKQVGITVNPVPNAPTNLTVE